MNTVRACNERIRSILPYDPKSLPAKVFLSANENSRDIPLEVRDEIDRRLETVSFNRYPDPLGCALREAIAESFGLEPGCVLLGNGGDEHLLNLFLAYGGPGRKALVMPPTFSVYAYNANLTGTKTVEIAMREDFSIDEGAVLNRVSRGDIDIVIVTSPNNPTGGLADLGFMESLLEASDTLVLADEAYGEFSGRTCLGLMEDHPNLLILHTFSKAYSLAGVRMGYILGSKEVISEFSKVRQPYSVDAVSQCICQVAWEMRELFEPGIRRIAEERANLSAALSGIPGVEVFPSNANFLLVRLPSAHEVWQALYERHSVLVRDFSSTPRLEGCLRITVGTPDENETLIAALKDVMGVE